MLLKREEETTSASATEPASERLVQPPTKRREEVVDFEEEEKVEEVKREDEENYVWNRKKTLSRTENQPGSSSSGRVDEIEGKKEIVGTYLLKVRFHRHIFATNLMTNLPL
jgi:hypothetical protein